MTIEQIDHWKAVLRRAQNADRTFRVFGASTHRYRINPPLGESQLRAFEQRHNVNLPSDYRDFLHRFGDGGAGPDYGLVTLEEAARESDLQTPFLLTQTVEGDDLDEKMIEEEAGGVLGICSHGCAIYWYLVVNGSTFGTIWQSDQNSFWSHTKRPFLDWYRWWIDDLETRILPILANEQHASAARIGMSKSQVIELLGPHCAPKSSAGTNKLNFENLATQFVLDEREIVTFIVDFPIL